MLTTPLEALLRCGALNNLQVLEFSSYQRPPPASLFPIVTSPTLCVVTIGCCNLPDGTFQGLHSPLPK